MKNIFFKKIKTTKREAGAMMILLLVFFVIFILAFGSAYLVFLNTSRSVDMSHGIKARQAAAAGKERALYEAIKNNYDFAGACIAFSSTEIFSQELSDGSSYSINCVDDGVNKSFFAIGKYKRVEASLEIDCINIEKDCSASCKTGSICGGGKLLKTDTYALSISPSGCDASGANCDNKFLTADTVNFQWDTTVAFQCGTSTVDYGGKTYNTVAIGTQCWLAENLDIGSFVDASVTQTNNSVIEKYCYNNSESGCSEYGGFYQWNEATQYTHALGQNLGAQGICPTDWSVPTNTQISSLNSYLAANSQYWCNSNSTYTGKSLAFTSGWGSSTKTCRVGNDMTSNNSSGFGLKASGYYSSGAMKDRVSYGYFWSSYFLMGNPVAARIYFNSETSLVAGYYSSSIAMPVRCILKTSRDISFNNAINADNGKINNTTLTPQTKTYLEAAKYCDDLVANGYSDWYLPATNELLALRNNSAFSYFNLQSVSGDDYWVSTEQGSTTPTMAGYIKMSTGVFSNADKTSEFKVRCVRKDTYCSSKTVCGSTCDYGGEEYETIQIGSQCWFKRNLNIGSMINSSVAQANNSVTEKYCYVNNASNCTTYGGLYQWNEAMQYSTSDGAQGLCPSGWHLPKDSDWTNLTNYLSANSQYWCSASSVYLAKSLSSVSGWNASNSSCTPGNLPANNNSTGFSAIPGGYFYGSGWGNLGVENYLWTSTTDSAKAWRRSIGNSNQRVSRSSVAKNYALTIRCLKD